jgi:hypothetical protein
MANEVFRNENQTHRLRVARSQYENTKIVTSSLNRFCIFQVESLHLRSRLTQPDLFLQGVSPDRDRLFCILAIE